MSLVIVGSIGLDTIETPMGMRQDTLGGSAVYGAISASFFSSTSIVGVVGTDFPPEDIQILKARGIGLEGMEIIPGKTFRWQGLYRHFNQAETIRTDLNVFETFEPKLPDSCRRCHSLLLGNIHPQLQLNVLNLIEHYHFAACDTMNLWINNTRDQLMEVLSRVNIVFVNEDEIKLLSGKSNVFDAAEYLLSTGVELIVIKRGEYGAIAITTESLYFVPAFPVRQVMDTTGAGDAFAGGFMGYLADKQTLDLDNIRAAMRFGTIMAAINVSSFSVDALVTTDVTTIDIMYAKLMEWT